MVFALIAALATAGRPVVDADTPLPPIDPDSRLRIARHEIVVERPVDELYRFWRTTSLADLAVQTDAIPQVVRTELLRGEAWRDAGTRRRVFLSDGSTATEEILVDDGPACFRYQVFGYTSATARFVEYGVGEFNLEPLADERTRVVWTYRFRPRTLLGKLFLGGWVRRNWSPWMAGYLENLQQAAEQPASER